MIATPKNMSRDQRLGQFAPKQKIAPSAWLLAAPNLILDFRTVLPTLSELNGILVGIAVCGTPKSAWKCRSPALPVDDTKARAEADRRVSETRSKQIDRLDGHADSSCNQSLRWHRSGSFSRSYWFFVVTRALLELRKAATL